MGSLLDHPAAVPSLNTSEWDALMAPPPPPARQGSSSLDPSYALALVPFKPAGGFAYGGPGSGFGGRGGDAYFKLKAGEKLGGGGAAGGGGAGKLFNPFSDLDGLGGGRP